MITLTVALLAYQEAENLKLLLPKIMRNIRLCGGGVTSEIIVVDSETSLDDTEDVCKTFGVTYINQESPGFGGAFKTAIQYAQGEYFLILDSDGSHNPDYISAMYKKFTEENCDLVIGSRYAPGGKSFDKKSSIVMSRMLNFAFRLCLGIQAKDISTDFRLYHTAQLKAVVLENVNYDILQEVLLKLKLNKPDLKIGEVPITFEKRIYGESKRRLLPFICSYLKSLFRLTALRFTWLRAFVLYALIGAAGAVLDYSVFFMLTRCALAPELCNVLGGVLGFLFTFTVNTVFNFKARTHLVKRFCSYGLICLLGLAVTSGCMAVLKNYVNLYLLKLLLLCAVSVLQFVLNRAITYKQR